MLTGFQYLQWAQLSTHGFVSEDELKEQIIYNYSPIRDPHGYFDQVYVFNHSAGVV
jgi:hypothetical protein